MIAAGKITIAPVLANNCKATAGVDAETSKTAVKACREEAKQFITNGLAIAKGVVEVATAKNVRGEVLGTYKCEHGKELQAIIQTAATPEAQRFAESDAHFSNLLCTNGQITTEMEFGSETVEHPAEPQDPFSSGSSSSSPAPAPAPAPAVVPAPVVAPAPAPVAPPPPAPSAPPPPPEAQLTESDSDSLYADAEEKEDRAEELLKEQKNLWKDYLKDTKNDSKRTEAAKKWNEYVEAKKAAKTARKVSDRTDDDAGIVRVGSWWEIYNRVIFSAAYVYTIDGLHVSGGLNGGGDSSLTDIAPWGVEFQARLRWLGIYFQYLGTHNDTGDNASMADIAQVGAVIEPEFNPIESLGWFGISPSLKVGYAKLVGGNGKVLIDSEKADGEDFNHLVYSFGLYFKFRIARWLKFVTGGEIQNPGVLADHVGGMEVDDYQDNPQHDPMRAKLPTFVVKPISLQVEF